MTRIEEYALELIMSQYKNITLSEVVNLLQSECNLLVTKEKIRSKFAEIINNRNLDSFDVESRKIEYYETAVIY
jgi:hypothetical protein